MEFLGIEIAFTKIAVVLAVIFVASPFYVRTASPPSRRSIPLPDAARTLGAGPGRRFLPDRAAACGRRSRRRGGARVRPRDRRVRRDDHVRRLSPGRHADALARRLRAVRRRLRRRPRDRRRARSRQRRLLLAVKLVPSWRSTSTSTILSAPSRLSLTVARGTTTALVGPSGAGKSSVLRASRGCFGPRAGARARRRAWLDTAAGIDLPPERRSVGLVFQEYALFPHLDVRRNVRFGAVDEARRRAARAFRISHLPALAPETCRAASGNVSRSRARSRATRRSSSSTNRSRRSMPTPAACSQRAAPAAPGELRLPTLLVTHDFEDAAALADSCGVIVDGRILQLGTAAELSPPRRMRSSRASQARTCSRNRSGRAPKA